jgi:hypothetical protein
MSAAGPTRATTATLAHVSKGGLAETSASRGHEQGRILMGPYRAKYPSRDGPAGHLSACFVGPYKQEDGRCFSLS